MLDVYISMKCFKKVCSPCALRHITRKHQWRRISTNNITQEHVDPSKILIENRLSTQKTKLYDKTKITSLAESICCPKEYDKYPMNFYGLSFAVFDNLTILEQYDYLYHLNLPEGKRLNFEENSKYLKSVTHFYENLKYSISLASYFQVCIDAGFMKTVESTLLNSPVLITNTKLYNSLLHEICETQRFEAFRRVCNHFVKHKMQYDATTFALLFQCLGTFKEPAYTLEKTKYFLDVMKAQNIKVEKVFRTENFYEHDDTCAKIAVGLVDPSYVPVDRSHGRYSCSLLQPLNDTLCKTDVESPMHNLISKDDLKKAYLEQIDLEKKGLVKLKSISSFHKENSHQISEEISLGWKEQWRQQFSDAFRRHRNSLQESFANNSFTNISLYPYLTCLDDDDYVDVVCNTLYDMKSVSAIRVSPMALHIGRSLSEKYLQKYSFNSDFDEFTDAYLKLCDWYHEHSTNGEGYNPTVKWETLLKEANMLSRIDRAERIWSKELEGQIGETMIELIFNNLTIPITSDDKITQIPAFEKGPPVEGNDEDNSEYSIKPCQELQNLQSDSHILFRSDTMPMFCPPLPWISVHHGGYIHQRKALIRSITCAKQFQLIEEAPKNLQPILDGLSQLASVPWKINTEMLDLLIHVFRNGGWPVLNIPADIEPTKHATTTTNISHTDDKGIPRSIKQGIDWDSMRTNFVNKLTMAEYYRNRYFWFPYCIDFRGRAYPRPTNLTHSDADSYRSLLLFVKGKRLGPDGLRWLKIHVINLNGLHKEKTLNERLQFCENNLDLIFDSADNPIKGKQWWSNSSNPWQCLAACKELTKVLRSDSPEDCISHLPVHQDGTCNGLQHYAALGKDTVGATAVNVKPSPAPKDVYGRVLDMVKKKIRFDVLLKIQSAIILEPLIGRKIIKKTVIGYVYGISAFGSNNQIKRELCEDIPNNVELDYAAQYLTAAIFKALKTVFPSARQIQLFLQDYANLIANIHKEQVSWYTPLGLPIVQPYLDQFTTPQERRLLNSKKHETSLPPNFIHSLDATHMYLMTMNCAHSGITLATVHDCFWTHACEVDRVNVICREQFKNIYSLPLLEDLKAHFDEKYSMSNLVTGKLSLPKAGDFDINEVKSSTYFFS